MRIAHGSYAVQRGLHSAHTQVQQGWGLARGLYAAHAQVKRGFLCKSRCNVAFFASGSRAGPRLLIHGLYAGMRLVCGWHAGQTACTDDMRVNRLARGLHAACTRVQRNSSKLAGGSNMACTRVECGLQCQCGSHSAREPAHRKSQALT